MDNADKPITPKRDAVENLMDRLWVIKEKALFDTLNNTGVISQNTTLAGTDQWDDYNNSDPIGDIRTGIVQVKAGSGKVPNTMVLGWDTLQQLIHHPDFVARASGVVVVTGEVVMQIIQKVFPSIKTVLVGTAQYNSGVEGGTDTLAEIWSAICVLAYIERKPRLKSRTLGVTYQKTASRVVDELPMSRSHETWDRKGDMVRVTDEYDQKLVDEKCAYLIKSTQ